MPRRFAHSRRSSRRLLSIALPAISAATLYPGVADGGNVTWTNPLGGSWSDTANWAPGTPPKTGNDTAIFNLGSIAPDFSAYSGYTVDLPTGASVSTFYPNVTLQKDKVTLIQAASNSAKFTVLSVANAANQSASLTLSNGRFSTTTVWIATAGVGTLNVSPGTILNASSSSLAASGSGGTATLTAGGLGAFLQTISLDLANGPGSATLNLADGAVALSYTGLDSTYPTFPSDYNQIATGVANLAAGGGTAHVTADGPGTTFAFATWNLANGAGSTATMAITGGAQGYVNQLTLGTNGGIGSLTLDGPGTVLNSRHGTIVVGQGILSGRRGTGNLTLTNGAALTGPQAEITVGDGSGAGTLSILSGSSVTCVKGYVNSFSSAIVGSDAVAPSTWTVSSLLTIRVGSVTVNPGGQLLTGEIWIGTSTRGGSLVIHGGSVTASGPISLMGGSVSGAGDLHAPSLTADATIAPEGTLMLGTDLTLHTTARTAFDITSPALYDRLTGIGILSFGGTLAVSLDPSYAPAHGDTFDLFDFGSAAPSTAFSSLVLPPLPPDLRWDTSALYSAGILGVVPEPASLILAIVPALLFAGRRPRQLQSI